MSSVVLTETSLVEFWQLIEQLRADSSRKAKQQLVEDNLTATNMELWRASLDPYRVYHMTSDLLKKHGAFDAHNAGVNPESDFQEFLTCAADRSRGHLAMAGFWRTAFGLWCPEARQAAMAVLDKDLNTGVAVSTYNGVLRGCGLPLIPEMKTALGEPYAGQPVWEETDRWYVSRKYDGVRCLLFCYADSKSPVQAISRQGQRFRNLNSFRTACQGIGELFGEDVVLDGELAVRSGDGEDDFKAISSALNRKSGDINAVLHVFDLLPMSDFNAGKCKTTFSERLKKLRASGLFETGAPVAYVKQRKATQESVSQGLEYAVSVGWEGLILRKDAPYAGKRSNHILKCKQIHDLELKVVDVVQSERLIDGVMQPALGSAIVEYTRKGKTTTVGVGSGWTKKQVLYYNKHPEKLIGATLTVAYTTESEDEDGDPSLQFPRVRAVHAATDRCDAAGTHEVGEDE